MAKHPVCRFCKLEVIDFSELQLHCELKHTEEYNKVQQWLGKTIDVKLKVLEAIAKESMQGYAYDIKDLNR